MHFTPDHRSPQQPTPLGWHFVFVDKQLLIPEAEDQAFGATAPALFAAAADESRHYLGQLDGYDVWTLTLPAAPPGWRAVPLRAAMMQFDAPLLALAGRAAQVLEWDRAHRFCGVCGTPTERHPGERSRVCPACRHAAYPRISPAMMALVWREGELLLGRAPHFPPGMYSALAGFVEPGETLEECVAREVAEEVGVRVKQLRYFGSQSWPFPHSLMLAFTAEWDGGEIVPQADEIEHAAWFPIDALPGIPPRFSIAGHLIRDTVAAMRQGTRP
ncbi:NAD(+) diphosphatase [Aquincola sp. J276]|uniref:NAD(+) diphosphatase n=1 Tax=Aquincola sp. J276 TaxID=2898432 RepID=UPI00215101B4|nr:NAD(+) diphosphatase [Aquincola sp. J276]MCR5863866.1 NAD(+) diphosphatase [Aquincola sp. J276]